MTYKTSGPPWVSPEPASPAAPLSAPTPSPAPPSPAPEEPALTANDVTAPEEELIAAEAPLLTTIETGADQLLSTAPSSGVQDPFATDQGGWSLGLPAGALAAGVPAAFNGQLVDSFTNAPIAGGNNPNPWTGGSDVDPFAAYRPASGLDTSQMIASNGPIPTSDATASLPPGAPPGATLVQETVVQGLSPVDTATINGTTYAHYQTTIDGVPYNIYFNDVALHGQAMAVPVTTPPAPAAAPPPAPESPVPPAPASSGSTPVSGPQPASGTPPAPPMSPPSSWFGDLLAGIAGLFGPSSVGPYLRPQTPANLPPGLAQMGQMNASMAQQALQNASLRTRVGVAAAGTPYALTLGAMTAPVAGTLIDEGGFAFAARFPGTTSALTDLGNAVTGTTIPRVAIAGSTAIAGGVSTQVVSEIEDNPAFPQQIANTLGPELSSSLPMVTAPAPGGGSIIVDANVLARAADQGNANALAAIRSGQPYVTLSQLREFLDVGTEVQQTGRAQFLLDEGVLPLPSRYGQLNTPQLADTFWRIANQQGTGDTTGDAALVIQGIQSGFTIVTGDQRLINTIQQTLRIPGATFVRVQF